MQSELILSLIETDYGGTVQPKFEGGRFTLVNRSMASVAVKGERFRTNLELSSDFQVCGFKPELILKSPSGDFTGFNKKYMDEDGVYNPVMAMDEFSKHIPGTRLSKTDVESLARSAVDLDAQEMFIYNMLCSWWSAALYTDCNGSDNKFKVQQSGFKDSHVKMGVRGAYVDMTHEIELGPPVQDWDSETEFKGRSAAEYWNRPYVIRMTNKSAAQVSFYLAHTFGRDAGCPLNTHIQLPGIQHRQTYFEVTSGELSQHSLDIDGVPWGRADVIWMWIKDYVTINRLQTSFAAAFELLASVATQPMPSYHESAVWHKAKLTVHLAPFTPTRARVPSNLEGEPYMNSTDPGEFVVNEALSPRKYIFTSALLNYYMWLGAYAVLENYSRDVADWTAAYLGCDEELSVFEGRDMRAALVSVATGKTMVTCTTPNAYFGMNLAPMADVTEVVVDELVDPAYPKVLPIRSVVPYVSGSLVLGAVAAPVEVLQHLQGVQRVTVDEYGTVSPANAVMLANVYRLFGHVAEMRHDKSLECYETYANHRECVVDPTTVNTATREYDRIKVLRSYPRDGRSDGIAVLETLRRGGSVDMTVNLPTVTMVKWQRRTARMQPTAVLKQRKMEIKFMVKGSRIYTPVTLRANKDIPHRAVFRGDDVLTAPLVPMPRATVVPTLLAAEQEELVPAADAE